MYCKDKIIYTIKSGDSLYKLAKQHMTTVTELILGNPGVNPYNLQVGMKINICPGPGFQVPAEEKDEMKRRLLRDWLEHVYWTRMYLMSIPENDVNPNPNARSTTDRGDMTDRSMTDRNEMTDRGRMTDRDTMIDRNSTTDRSMDTDFGGISDPVFRMMQVGMNNQEATAERLMRNVGELVGAIEDYLSQADANDLRNLLTQQNTILEQMIQFLKDGEQERYQRAVTEWYENAAQIAELLGRNMTTGSTAEVRKMLMDHLDLTRQEIEEYMDGEFQKSIETFDIAAEQIEELADYLADQLK